MRRFVSYISDTISMKKKNSELSQLIFRLQKFQDWRRGKIDFEKYKLNPKQIGLDIDAAIAILKEIESRFINKK